MTLIHLWKHYFVSGPGKNTLKIENQAKAKKKEKKSTIEQNVHFRVQFHSVWMDL